MLCWFQLPWLNMYSEFWYLLWIDPVLHGPPQSAGHWAAYCLCPLYTFLLLIFEFCGVTCLCLYPVTDKCRLYVQIWLYNLIAKCNAVKWMSTRWRHRHHWVIIYSLRVDCVPGTVIDFYIIIPLELLEKKSHILTSNNGTLLWPKVLGSTIKNSS